MSAHTFRRLLIASVVWTSLFAPPAVADLDDLDDLFSLPRITVNVTIRDGVVVAYARTLDQAQRVLWRVPLARAGPNVAITRGPQAVMVEVGDRQFVIDKVSGRTRELRPGEVYRELPGSMEQEPRLREPLSQGQEAVDRLSVANQRLEAALAELEYVRRLEREGRARPQDVQRAAARVEEARKASLSAQEAAVKRILPDPARKPKPQEQEKKPATRPAPRPNPSPPPQAVRMAQERLMDRAAALGQARRDLEQTHMKHEAGLATAQELDQAQRRVTQLEQMLEQADRDLQKARATGDMPKFDRLTPQLRTRLSLAERNVLAALETHELAEAQLLRVQEAVELGEASQVELNQAQARLLETFKQLRSARQALGELQRLAGALVRYQETAAPATQPAEK